MKSVLLKGDGVHTLIWLHQKLTTEHIYFGIGFYTCAEFFHNVMTIG